MTKKLRNNLIKSLVLVLVLTFAFCTATYSLSTAHAQDSSIVTMTAGASVNVTEEKSGLRFRGVAQKQAYDQLVSTYGEENVSLGMMTVPTDMVKAASTLGKAFTIEGLSTYEPLNGYDYYAFAANVKESGGAYYFNMTIPSISEANYNRKFSARAFIKVVTSEAMDNAEFSAFDGAYYSYAAYNETDNARSIYETAYSTYIDRTPSKDANHDVALSDGNYGVTNDAGLAVCKTYIDGVAVVEKVNGTIKIANNHEFYTSPYTLEANGDYYAVKANPKGLIYNGQRCKDLYATDGDIIVSSVLTSGATLGDNKAVSMECKGVSGAAFTSYALDAIMNNKYIAYSGNYGVNTYIDFTFTGNNMPSVMFFADEINSNMSGYSGYTGTTNTAVGIPSNQKGIVITSGFTGANPSNAGYDRFQVWGPNRIYTTGAITGAYSAITKNAIICKVYGTDTEFNALTQKGLNTDYTNTNFKYTLGVYDDNGTLILDVNLYDLDNKVKVVSKKLSLGIATSSMPAGNIVVYSAVKGSSYNTEFDCSNPYYAEPDFTGTIYTNKATVGDNNAATVNGQAVLAAGYTSQMTSVEGCGYMAFDAGYVAIAGKYGFNNYIDITYSGNNMPNVLFFADKINSDITQGGGKGLLLASAILCQSNWRGQSQLAAYGPNRIPAKYDDSEGKTGAAKYGYVYGDSAPTVGSLNYSDYPLLTTKGLREDTSGDTYKLTLGTFLNAVDNVCIDIILYNLTDNVVVYDTSITTTLTENDVSAGAIVLYGAVKGSSNPTTFTFSEPYISDTALEKKVSTITLAANSSTGGYAYHLAQRSYSYVALKGNYDIGTFIDITFTGNNMPNVAFFVDQINGNLTSAGGSGVLVMNGNTCDNAASNYLRSWSIFGPNRINDSGKAEPSNTYSDNNSRIGILNGYNSSGQTGTGVYQYPYLCQQGLATTPDVSYKYTVGTGVSSADKLVVSVKLSKLVDNEYEVVYDVDVETTLYASDVSVGNIVLYGAIKGSSESTTFSYSKPYVPKAVQTNTLTFEDNSNNNVSFSAQNNGVAQTSSSQAYTGDKALEISNLSQNSSFRLYGYKLLDNYNVNDVLTLSVQVYLDAQSGANVKIGDASGDSYTYFGAAQAGVFAGDWTKVFIDVKVLSDGQAKYIDLSFKLDGYTSLDGIKVYIDDVKVSYNKMLNWDLLRTEVGLGGNTIYMLPMKASQGMSYIIVNSDGDIIIIDGGWVADATVVESMVATLTPVGKTPTVKAWFLTHGHCDHIGAIGKVIENGNIVIENLYHDIPTDETVWGTYESDSTDISERKALFDALAANPTINVIRPVTGTTYTYGSAAFKILYTPTDNGQFSTNYGNNTSVIYKMLTSEKDILFLGDAGTDLGAWLIENAADDIKSDIVQMAHHGQNGVREACYVAINPSIALWPTTQGIWENASGSYETTTVRGWMEKIGAVNYVTLGNVIQLN